jgi:hypothetical protein
MGIERNEVEIESERDNEILLMLQDNDQYELERDEELIHEHEKNQIEDDILYELKDANERIVSQQRQLDNENRRKKGQQRTNYFTTKATG